MSEPTSDDGCCGGGVGPIPYPGCVDCPRWIKAADQPFLPSSDPCDYATYGAWFEALRVRGDIEWQRRIRSAENKERTH